MPPENKKSEARSFFRFVPIKTTLDPGKGERDFLS